jgi:hypothetical protein|tara:strand:+ start:388 stop:738 length:351 start_codon:yes stop_codon:yes gene_type:complete
MNLKNITLCTLLTTVVGCGSLKDPSDGLSGRVRVIEEVRYYKDGTIEKVGIEETWKYSGNKTNYNQKKSKLTILPQKPIHLQEQKSPEEPEKKKPLKEIKPYHKKPIPNKKSMYWS